MAKRLTNYDWTRKLEKPVDLGGRRLVRTLADVREHLMKLPEERHAWRPVQYAAGVLLKAAETGDVHDISIVVQLVRRSLHSGK